MLRTVSVVYEPLNHVTAESSHALKENSIFSIDFIRLFAFHCVSLSLPQSREIMFPKQAATDSARVTTKHVNCYSMAFIIAA